MATIRLTDVLANPGVVAEGLQSMDCVDSASVVAHSEDRVTIRLVLLPHDPTGIFIAQGYPVETVQVVVRSDGRIRAVPKSGRGRRWKHRNSLDGILLDLCLWDPHDPEEIRWSWDDGLEAYIRIVARHLIYEELWRRTDLWPVEDSPHGTPPDGAWPIRTSEMRRASRGRRG